MKLEKQVSSIEQSKKLKELLELGQWKNIDFNFYWMKTEASENYFLTTNDKVGGYAYPVDSMPAFTSAELGVMLPMYYETHRGAMDDGFYCSQLESKEGEWFGMGTTEAMAKADMVIRLIEEGKLKAEEVNQRLNHG